MKVVLSTPGKAHFFDLARQLNQRGMLETIYTGYPRYKLKSEGIPAALIYSLPLFSLSYQLLSRLVKNQMWVRAATWFLHHLQDASVRAVLPHCDVFVGASATSLLTGLKVKQRGGLYICDRGCSHIRYQDEILRDEFARHDQPYVRIHPLTVAREEQEYAAANLITVPSTFALRSFVEMGVPLSKLRLIPYGVDLSRFYPVAVPDPQQFNVLFVGTASLQKGIPYLLDSFEKLVHSGKRLTLAGHILPEVQALINQYSAHLSITCLGHVPQPKLKELMSRSHLLVLPSVQEGFGLVMAQAMACGCPVVASEHTGAPDLYQDGVEGFIVPIRDSETLRERMQRLADDPALQQQMSKASLECVRSLGGWDHYGDDMVASLQSSLQAKPIEPLTALVQKRSCI